MLLLDFSKRRSQKLPGSPTPDESPGEATSIDVSPGIYQFSSTGPYVIESGPRPSLESFYGDDAFPLLIRWPGGRMSIASASGKSCHVHIVPGVEVGG